MRWSLLDFVLGDGGAVLEIALLSDVIFDLVIVFLEREFTGAAMRRTSVSFDEHGDVGEARRRV